jgi:hypothetical protein
MARKSAERNGMRTSRDAWFLAQRPWTRSERLVVWRGFWGRFFIAIEPVILSLLFAGLTVELFRVRPHGEAMVLAPIFACAALAFTAYGIALMVKPIQALAHTFSPIYIVDGYIRYRKAHPFDEKALAYVGALDDKRRLLGEWPLENDHISEWIHPAMIEFSRYGGIHRIDGKATGTLPKEFPPLGIGATSPMHFS